MKVSLEELSHRQQPGVSTVPSEPPRCGGLSLCRQPRLWQKQEWLLPASLEIAGACRHGREPGAPRGVALKVGGLVVQSAAALGGFGKAALRADVRQVQSVLPQRVFLGALFSGNRSIVSSWGAQDGRSKVSLDLPHTFNSGYILRAADRF